MNDQSVSTQKTYQSITIPTVEEPHPTITIPCWESFPVSFPVGNDVVIEVTYTTEPYHGADASYSYAYILETGVGWKDTIGQQLRELVLEDLRPGAPDEPAEEP